MKKNGHVFGGVLLIAGTTLGGGMLAFPVVTAFGGFFPSAFLFLLIWLVMLCSALFFLDANLSIKGHSNMVTMADKRLGAWGRITAWIFYLLLLYSLTAFYIAGCTPLLVSAIEAVTGWRVPSVVAPFSLPVLFGGFVYFGTRGVDLINRLLMTGLIVAYFLLVFFVPAQVHGDNLLHFDFPAIWLAVPAVITAFGYHIIIPSLVGYLGRDVGKLRKTILIGSSIPIAVYLLWQVLVLGAVPLPLLTQAYLDASTATVPLAKVLHNPWISLVSNLFAFFAIVTSFIGVTLSLADFLSDGFKIKRNWRGRVLAIFLTFVPPLFFVFTYQKGFYAALQYAGAFIAILLIFLPAAMVWKLPKYRTPFRRAFVLLIMLLGLSIVVFDFLEEGGKLKKLAEKYTEKVDV